MNWQKMQQDRAMQEARMAALNGGMDPMMMRLMAARGGKRQPGVQLEGVNAMQGMSNMANTAVDGMYARRRAGMPIFPGGGLFGLGRK